MLDKEIEQAIATGQPIEFKLSDLDTNKYKIIGGTSLEVEREINRLGERGYVPIGGVACAFTSHGLVYAQLMENLYYNPIQNETQMDSENSGQDSLGSADGIGGIFGTEPGEGDGTEGAFDGATEVGLG